MNKLNKKMEIMKSNIKRKKNKNPKTHINAEGKVVKRKISGKKIAKFILLAFFVLCILGLFTIGLFFGYIIIKSPKFNPEDLYNKASSVLVDKDGNEYAHIGSEVRDIVDYDQLPEVLVDAVVATEDSRFFQHNGFDLPRFAVATIKQLLGNSSAGGASTLTMQISKNKLTSTTDTGIKGIIRKFTDIYLSIFKIEKTYTKQEIIEFYVNSNYLGSGANGVEDAAKAYFNKDVSELNVSEAAMIAGLFNAPDYYDPYKNPDGCEQRRETVLYLMKRHGYITEDEYNIAMKLTVDIILNPEQATTGTDYQGFINTVVEEVIDKTGNNPYDVPMKIYTTMDASQQAHMESIMNGTYSGYKWQNDVVQGGIAVLDAKTGAITAVGAGRNRTARSYNYATDIKAQIGSTAKPLYDYSLGIEYKDWSTYQIFVDEPWGYANGTTNVKNWSLNYKGFVTMRQALVDSINIAAIKAFQSVDNKTRVSWVQSLGLHPEIEDGMIHEAHALGGYNGESPVSLAAAYNAFANGGYYIEPYSFTKIEYLDGSADDYEYKYSANKVMSEETAYMMTNMLISVAKGTGFSAFNVNGVTYAGKSGTTNLDDATIKAWNLPSKAVADIWAVGYTDKYTIAAWYGYDNMSSTYYNTFGSQQNYRLFCAAAKGVFTEQSNFVQPDGVTTVQLEKGWYDATLPSEYTPASMITTEYFKKGTEPTTVSDRYSKLSDVTNLKATKSSDGTKVKLSWSGITTPHAIDMDYLKSYFGAVYKNADWGVNAATTRYNENMSQLGTIVYKIYENNNLVGTTSDTSIELTPTSSSANYVVKTSYTVFTANASDGVSVSVSGINTSTGTTTTCTGGTVKDNKCVCPDGTTETTDESGNVTCKKN